ncbi:hypothetical protein SLA2020_238290 [Shorea laevis]
MADAPSSPATLDPSSQLPTPESGNPNQQPDPPSASATTPPPQESSTPLTSNSTSNAPLVSPQPPLITSYAAPPISGATTAVLPAGPSFRPVPLFSPLQNYQLPGVPPPGVSAGPVVAPGSVPTPMMPYQVPPGQAPNPALRPFAPVPNGYAAIPGATVHGAMPLPGLPRYPSPYPTMVRPFFTPRPPGAVGVIPAVPRAPVGIPGVRPILPPVVRPGILPAVMPAEKPQTTVYIGKIAPTVDNDFMLSLLSLCGPVKSWKRAQDPTDGTPRAFGFCEFESAEGVLRALRLLSKFNIDGQELSINVNQATREYLELFVKKKMENAKKLKETQAGADEKEGETEAGNEKSEPSIASVDDTKEDSDAGNKKNLDISNSGIVTDEDQEADKEALEKLTSMIEERLKTKPLPPPPAQPAPDSSMKSNSEMLKSKDGDSDGDMMQSDGAEGKNEEETTSDSKATTENDKPESSSPDHRNDRRSRDRDREQDLKREKEREIERLERVTERERARKEREQRRKIDEAEREYEKCLRDWEQREKDKEKQRQYEKEREKERERKRKKEILYDEEDNDDDDSSRKRWHRSVIAEKRRKRLREKEEDLADRLKEEKEIAEAKKMAEDQQQQLQQQRDALRLLSNRVVNGVEKILLAEESTIESKDMSVERHYEGESTHENLRLVDESNLASIAASDARQSGNAPARKLGFGLVGSGKRTTVLSVFKEEDDDVRKDKKMRPLVPIDYSTEELQAIQSTVSGAPPPNLVAAAEFAKRISNINPKEEKLDGERERGRRSHDKSSRGKDRSDEDGSRNRDENKEKFAERDRDHWEHGLDKSKTADTQKLLDAKQLIDMIPKTKEELFSYEINWDVYDKHALHERMRPWISKKITEFLGEEEKTLVDYIVSSTQQHVKASEMLDLLQSILDEEAEMFVLKMWRMLIFEIKKLETGLALRSKGLSDGENPILIHPP